MQLLFNFGLVYTVGKVQVNQEGLKVHETHDVLTSMNKGENNG